MPKPDRKPWSRWTSTETPFGLRSSIAIRACLPSASNFALAHCPMRLPAWKLSVAKVASAASGGSTGVSSAMTSMPACLALSSDGTIALESFAVIMKPLAPAEIRFSIAWTWASLSPSCLPANDCSVTPACWAACVAPSFIFTKNGLVSVLVIRPTITSSPDALALAPDPLELDDPAATARGEHEGGREAGRDQGGTAAAGGDGVPHWWDLSSSSTRVDNVVGEA